MQRFLGRWAYVSILATFILGGAATSAPLLAQGTGAQGSGVGQITGTVLDGQRHALADADVRLVGPISSATSTATDGSFTFLNLPAGTYRIDVSKGGFVGATQDNVVIAAGSTTSLSFALQSASLTSLTEIGHVSVDTRNSANAINTTPASIVDVPATTFSDQGQLSVNQVLNEEPGITIGTCGDGSSPLASGVPSVRGGLPYETESLIDGHAISLGQLGYFSPSFISPYMLQNVEVVKGPGATSPSINYAINGTVNYRTLEPTAKPKASVDFGLDQYGGNFANLRLTGTLPGGRLSYALDYYTDGTEGSERGLDEPSFIAAYGPTYLNGSLINTFASLGVPPESPSIVGSFGVTSGYVICCPQVPIAFNERSELGKVRYSFSPSTVLTLTWLGAQSSGNYNSWILLNYYDAAFLPPSSYSGSFPTGPLSDLQFLSNSNNNLNQENINLFEEEFHTPIGKTATLLLRQYSSSIQTFSGGPGNSGPTANDQTYLSGTVYGGVYLGTSTTPTVYDGVPAQFVINDYSETRSYNDLNGYTAEIDKQAGDDLLTLSYDYEKTSTLAGCMNSAIEMTDVITTPGGSSQTFKSLMGRVQFELGSRVEGSLSDNFGEYTDIYTQNGGTSFLSSSHTYEAPRLSLTWRANSSQSFRASIGSSIAPPYIALLNNDEVITSGNGVPARYYVETVNSGDVEPETAFGYDIGFDTKLRSPFTVLSFDAYQTLLHNQFLQSTSAQGTYTCPDPGSGNYGISAPLYVTKTANLGHSEYEGIEIALHRSPPTGWGYRIQGSLMRAFAYDLPAGFYNTPAGPNTTNLAVLPGINFQSSGNSYNGLGTTRIPYSMGYAELNYRGRNGSSFLAGVTYYGPNNSYDEPAFEVVTASFTQPITRKMSLQATVYNLTNAYPSIIFYPDYEGTSGIYTPLVNGKRGMPIANVLGPSTFRLMLHVSL